MFEGIWFDWRALRVQLPCAEAEVDTSTEVTAAASMILHRSCAGGRFRSRLSSSSSVVERLSLGSLSLSVLPDAGPPVRFLTVI